jgi:hypothetical protein
MTVKELKKELKNMDDKMDVRFCHHNPDGTFNTKLVESVHKSYLSTDHYWVIVE